jgi:microcystin degradation protein MlrC/enamine deaminase RidA (YjgF/YER057c/UK114 family)
MSSRAIFGPGLPKSSLPFSPAVQAGDYIFISGQASVDMDGNIVNGSFEEECRRSFENLKKIVIASGFSMQDIVQVRNYVGKQEYLASFNNVYREFFSHPYPARTTLIGCLGELLKFEVDAVIYTKSIRKFRIGLLGIYHESNTFINKPTALEDFKNGHWLKGEAIRREYQNAAHEIGGMLEVLDSRDVEVVPLMYAEATPGGIISGAAYDQLLLELMEELNKYPSFDGILVVPHGAGVSETYPDMDGHWLSLLRNTVGSDIPIVGTLDPHANVSEAMVRSTNALVAYKTNPHIDQRETGKEAANLILKYLNKEINPVQNLIQVPVAISIEQQNTSAQPCVNLYEFARKMSQHPGVISLSILLGFPYADVNEMGSSFILVTDGSFPDLTSYEEQFRDYMIKNKTVFVGRKLSIGSQLPLIKDFKKPALLLDMGDNIGGGAPGDSTYLLNALEKHGLYKSFICICDPKAVEKACAYKDNEKFKLTFGNNSGSSGDVQYSSHVTLLHTTEGKFKENSIRHGGQVSFDMGNIAIIETLQGNVVMLTSQRVPPFSLNQLTSFGINPKDFDVVVAKGVNAPIAAYESVCPTIVQIDTPGVTQADMTKFTFINRRRPLFPFEI